jgi:hypothetical protein
MTQMISNWRDAFATKDFPFAMMQLAAYYSSGADINAIRIAQSVATSLSSNTGMALAIDLGDPTAPLGPVHSCVRASPKQLVQRINGCPPNTTQQWSERG